MTKIKSSFTKVLTVHDELLSSLYSLKPETIYYQEINGIKYLINSIKSKEFEIGLRVKVEDKEIPDNTPEDISLKEYRNQNSNDWDVYFNIDVLLDKYSSRLTFSNMEKFLTNILFDKWLSHYDHFNMTFLEIEHKYRGKASKRSTSLNFRVAKRYANALDSLSNKNLFLTTTNEFRNRKGQKNYGVNNANIYQSFLTLTNVSRLSKNNILFTYTFSGFGRVIRVSKRYSTILPVNAYKINFNLLRKHLTGFYLAQEVFINLGLMDRHPSQERYQQINIDIESLIEKTTEVSINSKKATNHLRLKRNMVSYVEEILPRISGVIDYNTKYHYEETERFVIKHQFDYDIETDLDNYKFSTADLDQDVDVTITATLK